MTPNAVSIDKDADLAEAAKIMIRRHVSGLPVIGSLDNANQQPIGITSKSDIVEALTDFGVIREPIGVPVISVDEIDCNESLAVLHI